MRIPEENVNDLTIKVLFAKFIVFYLPSSENVNCSSEGTRKESELFEWFIFLHLWLNQPASALKEKIKRKKIVNVGTPTFTKILKSHKILIIVNEVRHNIQTMY